MKRTLMAGFIALALGGASFGQSSQSNPDPSKSQGATGQSSRDDTVLQKGNDSGSSTDQDKQRKQQKQNKQDKKGSNPASTPAVPPDENKGGATGAQPTVPPSPEPPPPPAR